MTKSIVKYSDFSLKNVMLPNHIVMASRGGAVFLAELQTQLSQPEWR